MRVRNMHRSGVPGDRLRAVDSSGTAPLPSETLIRACLEHAHELVWITDREGCCLWANAACREALGGEPSLIGKVMSLADTSPQGDSTRVAFARALREGTLPSTDIPVWPRRGPQRWLRVRTTAAEDRLVWHALDITEQRVLAARTQQLDELLDIAQEFGRLGLWERDVASGRGPLGTAMCSTSGASTRRAAHPASRRPPGGIHPEETSSSPAPTGSRWRRAGALCAGHYRVMRPDGTMRRIHSQWEVKSSVETGAPSASSA